ncbi:GlxA family transcriptional regulator [Nocardioides panaciterrulae]|uniref:Transcriptional regulator GlxA family with amidase domain n=1 Tax=Nocardioides panaciterrulae TaxID=661492 RepID=A0A7Y9E7U3_9ACTN|nr:helix-turn-helix domain-containing protein [Nocardioides panaciterrulae]NYD42515.1 transcriptional regulator GlxA family with amidase domain [Nocardioides panaciterrulae]
MAVIVVVAMDRTPLFHLSVPCEVLGADRSDMGLPRHDVRVARVGRGPVRSSSGVTLQAPYGLEALDDAEVVIVPWWGRLEDEQLPARLLTGLRRAHARGARIVGLCGGAFALAEAGLLDGRRATTHWRYAEELAARYPQVRVDPRVLYVDEGDVLTSAGTAAAIDLCLHLLRSLSGAEVANAVARRMVVPPHRAGGQAQYVDVPVPDVRADDGLASAMRWALEHLDRPLGVEELAEQAVMSRRTFTRQFRRRTGTSAHQWLLQQRTILAQRLLETTDLPVELVAGRSGFGSAVTLRTHFQRTLGTSPRDYRATFSRAAHPEPERIAAV